MSQKKELNNIRKMLEGLKKRLLERQIRRLLHNVESLWLRKENRLKLENRNYWLEEMVHKMEILMGQVEVKVKRKMLEMLEILEMLEVMEVLEINHQFSR